VLGVLRSNVAAVLGHRPGDVIPADVNLLELGFASLTALELSNRLRTDAGIEISAVALFDFPSLDALARFVHTGLIGDHLTV
jgi:acyl carrier protein